MISISVGLVFKALTLVLGILLTFAFWAAGLVVSFDPYKGETGGLVAGAVCFLLGLLPLAAVLSLIGVIRFTL